ncbi:hypothetical protein ABIE59_000427 [Marinobacter sp. MBR-99]|jgi:hypothetical protein|uniref:DUF4381 domain-containing protein n=1 Tax=Marinobacter sp. MBR-99 TaxID=3156461 RepID=UPI0033923A7F
MNGQDPLAQLRDIHLPETGGIWPPAPGWWLLAILCAVGLVVAVILWRRQHRNTAWRREARRLMADLEARASMTPGWFSELNALLKRVARRSHPGQNPQAMSGEQWVAFLLATAPDERIASRPVVEAMVASTWQPRPTADPGQALNFAIRWLEAQL